jgi:hypothetical protein
MDLEKYESEINKNLPKLNWRSSQFKNPVINPNC